MAQEWSRAFYNSAVWDRCRKSFAKSKRGLCERCLAGGVITPGKIVHHKVALTPANIGDPAIALGFENLMLLCKNCHEEVHRGEKRYKVDQLGRVTAIADA